MHDPFFAKRAEILQQMAGIEAMELGSIRAEFRPGANGAQAGPYFKHQVWQDGVNQSQRVPVDQAPTLQAAIDNRVKFESLAEAFIQLTVEHTRAHRFPDALKKRLSRAGSRKKSKSRT